MNNHQEPLQIFANWLKEAEENSQIIEPRATNLAIVNAKNQPSSKMVLLTKFDAQGFSFSKNLNKGELNKGGGLNIDQNIALCFYWGALGKQVRIEGKIIDKKESNELLLIEFVAVPQIVEFWEEGRFRIHKRIKYQKVDNGWKAIRIYP